MKYFIVMGFKKYFVVKFSSLMTLYILFHRDPLVCCFPKVEI